MPRMIAKHSRRVLVAAVSFAFIACAHAPHEERYRNLELRLVSETGGQPFPFWKESGTLPLEPEILFSGKDFAIIEPSRGGDDKKTPSLDLHFTREASTRF